MECCVLGAGVIGLTLATLWSAETLSAFYRLAEDPNSGVSLQSGKKLFHRPVGPPWWKTLAREFRDLSREELPEGIPSGTNSKLR